MVTEPTTLQVILEFIGVFVFGLTGGLVALRAHLDLFGIHVLAGVTALGGGIIRDLLLGATPPVGVSDWRLVATGLAAGLVVFALHDRIDDDRDAAGGKEVGERPPGVLRRLRAAGILTALVKVLDAVGLSVFAVAGALKAIQLDSPALTAIIVGGVTAVGGGMIRDVLAGQVPEVLQRELYAVPAVAGAALIVGLDAVGLLNPVTLWLCVALVFVTRMVAVALDLNMPRPRKP